MNDTMTSERPTTARMLTCCAGIASDGHPLTNGKVREDLPEAQSHYKSDIGYSDALVERHAASSAATRSPEKSANTSCHSITEREPTARGHSLNTRC